MTGLVVVRQTRQTRQTRQDGPTSSGSASRDVSRSASRDASAGAPGLRRQVASFAAIGVMSTAAYVALYAILRPAMAATPANAIALIVTAVANTAANRRLTFARSGRDGAIRDQAAGLLAVGVALLITTASVALLGLVAPRAGRATELVVLVAANALATLCRFVLLRAWIASATHPTTRTGATQ